MNVELTVGADPKSPAFPLQLNDKMSVVQEALRFAPKSQYLGVVYTHLTVGTPFNAPHTLGVIPDEISSYPHGAVQVQATDGDRALWTAASVTMRADAAGVPVGIAVHKF